MAPQLEHILSTKTNSRTLLIKRVRLSVASVGTSDNTKIQATRILQSSEIKTLYSNPLVSTWIKTTNRFDLGGCRLRWDINKPASDILCDAYFASLTDHIRLVYARSTTIAVTSIFCTNFKTPAFPSDHRISWPILRLVAEWGWY